MDMALDTLATASDEALLVLFANGDPEAARVLSTRFLPRILGYAARILSGDRAEAEDVAQEAMVRLWRIARDWRQGEAQVSTWLYRVTTNLCTDRLRARRRRGTNVDVADVPDLADGRPSAVAVLMQADRMAALEQALESLPERQRQAVVLRHIEGLGNPEIAVVMDMSVEAVESLTARGKRALSAALAGKRAALGYEESDDDSNA
jgi:RNA polymerase sigma factor (sigma-70 family)